jgi:hypothetical protein
MKAMLTRLASIVVGSFGDSQATQRIVTHGIVHTHRIALRHRSQGRVFFKKISQKVRSGAGNVEKDRRTK